MNKKIRFSLFFVFVLSMSGLVKLNAQVSVNPDHQFYTIAQGWEIRGIVDRLPSLRPYPVSVIKDLIAQVMENGNENDKSTAEYYSKLIFGKAWNVLIEGEFNTKLVSGENNSGFQFNVNPFLQGDICILDELITCGYSLGVINTTDDYQSYLPLYTNYIHDGIHDPAIIGPFKSMVDGNIAAAVGTKDIYFQTGIYRSGWGLNLGDGLALNDSAFHSANISFHINGKHYAYTQQMSSIGAQSLSGSIKPDKWLAFHALDLYLHKKFTLSYYEASVFGQRFDFSYLFPSPYMLNQSLGGYSDNIWMGLAFEFKPFNTLAFTGDVFVDDLSMNNLVKLSLDGNNRVAMKGGLLYTPENSPCSRMAFNYTLITPYTYSHHDKDSSENISYIHPNYQNYTNNGIQMGSTLPPDSDCITFSVDLMPLHNLQVKIESRFLRHANICETMPVSDAMLFLTNEGLCSDGSVLTNSYGVNSYLSTSNTLLNFMTQEHKMYVCQGNITGLYSLPLFNFGQLSLKLSYTFEYINKKGVDCAMYPYGYVDYKEATDSNSEYWTVTLDGSATDYYTADEVVSIFKDRWVNNLHDVVNNYFYVGFVYKY